MRPVTTQTLILIKKYEGFRENAYLCPAGVWTIGYGSTRIDGKPVQPSMKITKEKAEELLEQTVASYQSVVLKHLKVAVNDQQLSALVSLAYNIGLGAFATSTLLRRLNEGRFKEASDEFSKWRRGGGKVLPGLVKRRAEEKALFLS